MTGIHLHSHAAHDHVAAHGTLMQRAAWAAVGVATLLIVLKLVAYIITDSIAMMASLADSALDLFASSVNLIAIRQALTPADAEHRFGHGKAEPLAGLMQGAFIAGSVAFLSDRIGEPAGRAAHDRAWRGRTRRDGRFHRGHDCAGVVAAVHGGAHGLHRHRRGPACIMWAICLPIWA